MNTEAMFKMSYGLYIVTSMNEEKANGCISNTVFQITAEPVRLCVVLNKTTLTHQMVSESKCLGISILTQKADFGLYKRFGYQSGRTTDKFAGLDGVVKGKNGVNLITEGANAGICASVEQSFDLGTHTMFICKVEDAMKWNDEPSVTYDYYQKNVKVQSNTKAGKGYRCKICDYVYEGETLPPDYICPVCKHPASDFEKIE